MSREWKPGDVAMVQCSDGEWRQAIYVVRSFGNPDSWIFADGNLRRIRESIARPLVVIDPEDREAVERLVEILNYAGSVSNFVPRLQAALREYANPKPPRPDEPQGLGAVVEDDKGDHWVLINAAGADIKPVRQWRTWWGNRPWADITVVRVLSPGVEVDQ